MYVPLLCKSNYSFLEGASSPGALVRTAHNHGLPAIGLCDTDGVYGLVRAHVAAKECGLPLLAGAHVTFQQHGSLRLLASNRKGYENLCQLLSAGRLRSPKGESRVSLQEVASHSEGLIALWHQPEDHKQLAVLRDAFGPRLYALLLRHFVAGEERQEHELRELAKHFGMQTVAGNEVLYHRPSRRDLQDVMRCIRHGTRLQEAGTLLNPNAHFQLCSPQQFLDRYHDDRPAVRRTLQIAEACCFTFDDIRYRYPAERLPDGTTTHDHLCQLTQEGLAFRYPNGTPGDVQRQIQHELELIRDFEYDGYFLTMYEIVQFCRQAKILCQGRGSAANSAVCYALGITAVDPVRMGLLFERFISRERREPPDIDLDIEHNRREEVIQHVYGRYGRRHAAMVANFIRYRTRSAVRDVGKALGFAETELERFCKVLPKFDYSAKGMRDAGFDADNPMHQHLLRLASQIQNAPRHLGVHPGGFLLGHQPVDTLVPIEPATMENRTVIQWDKEDVEDLGLFKVDLLGLGALHVVHLCFDLIQQHRQQRWTLATLPANDPPTYEMIQKADTVGVFQIESRAQMSMLPRLRPKDYYDLVIQISIIRPGPITGGMVHPYLRRRSGQEPVIYPHDSLEPVLKKTLGIPLFQEQVMQLAMIAADYTPGEADQLRRDMAAWKIKGKIEKHHDRITRRMAAKGIAPEFAERVFEQIKGFGEYGFPESHAASFALIAYATSWLKCHHPDAFLCAMLNAQPMGFYNPSTLIGDAKRHGVKVHPIDVQYSDWDCTLEPYDDGFAVRMGLRYVHGFHQADADKVLLARRERFFRSLDDFQHRSGLGQAPGARLAKADALRSLGTQGRRDAIWQVYGHQHNALPLETRETPTRFPQLSDAEEVQLDYESAGHSTRAHPLTSLRPQLQALGLPDAQTIQGLPHNTKARYAGMVICRQRPATAKGVIFMTLEDETGFVNLVIWQNVYQKHALLVKTQSFLGADGHIQCEAGVVHLVVKRLWIPELPEKETPQLRSRDFH